MAYWLDDGFDTWPETIRAGTAACGLYVRCGSWIARNLTDGMVPGEVAAMYGSAEWIRRLADAGLWEVEGDGYRDVFYFAMGNPRAEKVRARRLADADRKARWRDRRHQSRRKETRDETCDSARSHTVTDGVTPLSPALPPSLKGREGADGAPASQAARAAARTIRCPRHPTQPRNCAMCRQEQRERDGPPLPDAKAAIRAAIRKPATRPGRVRGLVDLRDATPEIADEVP